MIRVFGAPRLCKSDGINPWESIKAPWKPNQIPDSATQPFIKEREGRNKEGVSHLPGTILGRFFINSALFSAWYGCNQWTRKWLTLVGERTRPILRVPRDKGLHISSSSTLLVGQTYNLNLYMRTSDDFKNLWDEMLYYEMELTCLVAVPILEIVQ